RGVVGVGVQSTQSRASEYSMGYDAMSGESLGSGKAGVGLDVWYVAGFIASSVWK
ncbi:hypothetical protein A2U01_0031337, partial [Trifolium medium]|nr:hypothetical protein [Trifolium medium]